MILSCFDTDPHAFITHTKISTEEWNSNKRRRNESNLLEEQARLLRGGVAPLLDHRLRHLPRGSLLSDAHLRKKKSVEDSAESLSLIFLQKYIVDRIHAIW